MVDGQEGSHVAAQDAMEKSSAPYVLLRKYLDDPIRGMRSRPPHDHRWIHCGRTFLLKWLGAVTLTPQRLSVTESGTAYSWLHNGVLRSGEIDQGDGDEQSQV